MRNKRERTLIVTDVNIVPGPAPAGFITLITNEVDAIRNGEHFCLRFHITGQTLENYLTELTGVEAVQIQLGSNATPITVGATNRIGNVLYSDRLPFTIEGLNCRVFRLVYGNDGLMAAPIDVPPATAVGGVKHFMFLDVSTQFPARGFDGASTTTDPE